MDAIETIMTRRSIRKYTNEPVSDEAVTILLKAAMNTPSTANTQPWHFIVIRDHERLDQIPSFHPHSKMLRQANVAILVCGDPALEMAPGCWPADCAAVTENILLAAHAIRLGAVWLGLYPREERIAGIRALFNIPEPIVPLSLVSIGHPAEQKPPANRWNESKIHYDKW
ncbi:nitroreductase family protein [candidate division KSB1 bacterium]|nr:nitroreductase family protein [candidate division KSB1 bacterium]